MGDDMITELIQLDEKARAVVSGAVEERDVKKADIEKETADIRAQYLARAQRRVESMREQTKRNCEQQEAELAMVVAKARAELDESFAKNRKRWIDEIVNRCKQTDLTR